MTGEEAVDERTVERLKGLIEAVLPGTGYRVISQDLVGLASELADGSSITIDTTASSILGTPLVVLRLPANNRPPWFDSLTPREQEVAELVARGLRNREIAGALCISTLTAKDHVHRVLAKTGLPNRAAIAASMRRG